MAPGPTAPCSLTGPDHLREPAPRSRHQAHGALHHGRGSGSLWPRSTRRRPGSLAQGGRTLRTSARPPAVDALVVVADRKCRLAGAASRESEAELLASESWTSVHEQVGGRRPPGRGAPRQSRGRPARGGRVVEVQPARAASSRSYATNARVTGPASGSARPWSAVTPVQLEREMARSNRPRVPRSTLGRRRRSRASRSGADPVARPAEAQDLQAEGVERSHPDGTRFDAHSGTSAGRSGREAPRPPAG